MDWAERIGRRIRLRDLHVLLAVEQCGSMVKAAERLAVSQPVVSKVISDLERTLGVTLIERTRNGTKPTQYGIALLRRGVAVFDELRQGVSEIQFLLNPNAGEVRIGAADPMVAGLLPAVIDRVTREHPEVTFHLMVAEAVLHQTRELRARHVDFIIGRLPRAIEAEDDLHAEILYAEPVLIAAGAESPLARRRRLQLRELIDEPWCLPRPDSYVGSFVAEMFKAAGLPLPRRRVVCGSIQINNALLATGRYLAIYPGSLVRLSAKRLRIRVLPVDLPIQSSPVGIVTIKNRRLSPVAEMFVGRIREMVSGWGSLIEQQS